MNWLSLVTELEALIFWLASLILLAPKTLYCIIRRPKKMITVLSQEIDKRTDDKYDAYTSPITFWVIFSICLLIFHAILLEYIGFIIGGIFSGNSTNITEFEFNFSSNRITKAIIISIWPPLLFSYIILLKKKIIITKSNLENIFYMQCYLFGSFIALYTILSIFMTLLNFILPFNITNFTSLLYYYGIPIDWLCLILSLIWLINSELHLYKFYSVTTKRSTSYILILSSIFSSIVLVCLTGLLFIGLFNWAL
ncbi:hypothetical protein DOS84_14695 [Flavobacterium aquariorum]|uniref:Yip1 domain-containing protein n=1 Tax=Flavobacterium aquariorum TaxID=2217670 RepID=A0A2W7TVC7_9FLAO|nr:hypothetical protein [Flavobacterium aquariorum]PZX92700.1 hypothetical protein DOS84_14695 [Flavobacterium aquariorum]